MTYLLDTNILSYLDDPESEYYEIIGTYFSKLKNNDNVGISILSIFEYQSSIAFIQDQELKKKIAKRKNEYMDFFDIVHLEINQEEIFAAIGQLYKKQTGNNKNTMKKHTIDFILAS